MAEKTNVPEIRFAGFTDPWEQRRLGEVVDVRSGRDYKHLKPGLIPVYGTGGLMTYVNEALSKNEDAIGIGRKGTIDQPYKLYAPFWTVDTLFYAIPKIGIDIEFALSCFLRINWKAKDESTGLPSLSKSAINDTRILLPDAREQSRIGTLFSKLDSLIALHQRKYDKLAQLKKSMLDKMFPKPGERFPEIRFAGFTDPWEQRKLGELYSLVSEKNDLTFGRESIISVANMYFNANVNVTDEQYLRTYNVMRLGDIAFEGHSNKEFSHGRFVENYIGDGIVSHIFTVLRPHVPFDVNYWRYAINNEKLMRLPLIRSTKASTMMHDLVPSDFLREAIPTPTLAEQMRIGAFLAGLDNLITLHQRKLELLRNTKKSLLDRMFV